MCLIVPSFLPKFPTATATAQKKNTIFDCCGDTHKTLLFAIRTALLKYVCISLSESVFMRVCLSVIGPCLCVCDWLE
jgi:hypothetical protein